jgi:hypothetical protein
MSFIGDAYQVLKDDWNGNNPVGDTAKMVMDGADQIPVVGGFLPDGTEAKSAVEDLQGGPGIQNDHGNLGNEIGTVVGGLGGLVGGPEGIALGADVGSAVGGWLGDLF